LTQFYLPSLMFQAWYPFTASSVRISSSQQELCIGTDYESRCP